MAGLEYSESDVSEGHDRPLRQQLTEVYRLLLARYGPQQWWPADAPFEVIVGAILTQSAAWGNVEKAISNLKQAGALTPVSLRKLPLDELAGLIYPSGYYNAKALKIKSFVERLGDAHQDSLERLFSLDVPSLRRELLTIHGIGPETADSIILYAAQKPVFVIDAYTRRILSRLGLSPPRNDYSALQELFMENLPTEEKLFNEYHALLVRHGKGVCKKVPLCDQCCLRSVCLHR
ncbi:MAG: endonuclease III domain-containing protein [Dehalococcoidia bacterium]|nr:MAG: endonuclease III domain-containing protein [Dehalococcoidia bacterium]